MARSATTTLTVAPGSTPPEASLATPVTATVDCASAEPADIMRARATPAITRNMHDLSCRWARPVMFPAAQRFGSLVKNRWGSAEEFLKSSSDSAPTPHDL